MDEMISRLEWERYYSVLKRMVEEQSIRAEDIPNAYNEKIVKLLCDLSDPNEITEANRRDIMDAVQISLGISREGLEEMQQDLSEKDSSAQESPADGWQLAAKHYKHYLELSGDAHSQSRKRPERCLTSIAFWIPRKQREGIVGDILEDCHELRNLGKSNVRIWVHVTWQFLIAVVTSIPASILSAIRGKLTPKD